MKVPRCPYCGGLAPLKTVVSTGGLSLNCPHCNHMLIIPTKWGWLSILQALFAFLSGAVIRYIEYKYNLPLFYILPILVCWLTFLSFLSNVSWGYVTFIDKNQQQTLGHFR